MGSSHNRALYKCLITTTAVRLLLLSEPTVLRYCCHHSAAKAPFLARFKVRRCGVAELETIGMMPDEEEEDLSSSQGSTTAIATASALERRFSIFHSSSDVRPGHWQASIFKVGDDVRQVTSTLLLTLVIRFRTQATNISTTMNLIIRLISVL